MAERTIKRVGDTLIAGSRFRGDFAGIPDAFRRLHEKAAPHISGGAICLCYGQPAEGSHDLEICYPVSEAVEGDGIDCRYLEGVDMIAVPTEGTRETVEAVWEVLWLGASESLDERRPNAPPFAFAYLEAGDEFKESTVRLEVELLIPPSSPYWLAALGEGLAQYAGDEVRGRVMAGVEEITLETPPPERAAWVAGALERLEAEVTDEATRSKIMQCCSDRFPTRRIAQMKAEYERLGSIDALLAVMHMDRSVGGYSWYCQQVRVGSIIYTTKDPVDREGYRNAATPLERRMAACFCGLVKDRMRTGEPVPFTHCYCGAGWFHQLWEGILGRPVTVEILTSALQGDDICTFAVHLPDDV
jgi:hypothetical protein